MSLYLIKGQYRIVHSEPDGDSVHFIPGWSTDVLQSAVPDLRAGLAAAAGDARAAKSGVWEITDLVFTEG